MTCRRFQTTLTLLLLVGPVVYGQASIPDSAQARAFMGTWVIDMMEPAALKGTTQTVRVWDSNGAVAASIQIGTSPIREVTGIVKDGGMLVLTVSHDAQPPILENGAPIWAVISLILDGDTMKLAQMLERSQTIKRGSGKRQ